MIYTNIRKACFRYTFWLQLVRLHLAIATMSHYVQTATLLAASQWGRHPRGSRQACPDTLLYSSGLCTTGGHGGSAEGRQCPNKSAAGQGRRLCLQSPMIILTTLRSSRSLICPGARQSKTCGSRVTHQHIGLVDRNCGSLCVLQHICLYIKAICSQS